MFTLDMIEDDLRLSIERYNSETNPLKKRLHKLGIRLSRQIIKYFNELGVTELEPKKFYAFMDTKRELINKITILSIKLNYDELDVKLL